MKTRIAVLGVLVSGVLGIMVGRWTAPSASEARSSLPAKEFTGTVVRISNGNTLELAPVDPPGPIEKVRLLGIDAPGKGAPLYNESGAALAAITKGGPIRVEFDRAGRAQRDDYNRLLAYVFAADTNVNVELVRQGWAVYSKKYGGERFAAELRAAEDEARAARRGVWKGQK
jgi:endonuclease YncB( thermonuclease family)